jgi:hypothetical protein
VTVGGNVDDLATLTGGFDPTGTITFRLYGPGDVSCAGPPAFTSAAIPVSGNGAYGSGPFATLLAGGYLWTADYSGDANNDPAASACNAPNESVTVDQASPLMTSAATPQGGVPFATPLSDTATLAAGFDPTGNIVFTLYGPGDPTCAGPPAFTSAPVPVNGNGTYVSASFTPTQIGGYSWIASYSGDTNNLAVADSCGLPSQTVQVLAPITAPAASPIALLALTLGLAAMGVLAMRRTR